MRGMKGRMVGRPLVEARKKEEKEDKRDGEATLAREE